MRAKAVLIGLVTAVLAATACGSVPSPRAGGGDKLYLAMSSGHAQFISMVDAHSHQEERRLPFGAPSADWQHLYSLDSSVLFDTDPATGGMRARLDLQHAFRMPSATATGMPGGLSPNAAWLVVERYDQAGESLPTASHFLIINTAAMQIAARIDLDGFFDFDAISNDGGRMFLIQYLNGKEYYVRLYDVGVRKLDPNPIVDKSDGGEAMAGVRLSGVASSGGSWLFSIYVRDHANPFVHALSLDGPLALCLDLRGGGYADDGTAMQWTLAISPSGKDLYAANASSGDVARIDVSDGGPRIVRTERLAQPGAVAGVIKTVHAKEVGGNTAVVSADGRTVAVGGMSGIVWVDGQTLAVRQRALAGWPVASLGLSPDGKTLYAVSEGGRVALITMASAAVGTIFDLSGGQPMALMRVAAA
jgi:DNA-binding beta-propeller fold protein YncE